MSEKQRVVVGADGQESSIGALRWALHYAAQIGAEVEVVTGFTIPITIFLVPTFKQADYRAEAQAQLDLTLEQAGVSESGVEVHAHVMEVKPALALVNACAGASLVVVGAHNGPIFPSMHVGSTTQYIVNHAPCPVVVWRD